jgi:hypothetical protein
MRSDITPGGTFPDYELPDQDRVTRKLSEIQGEDPGVTPGIAATPARAPHPPAGTPGNCPTIEFARSDLAVLWDDDHGSLLGL